MLQQIKEEVVAATTTTASSPPKLVTGFSASDNFMLMYTVPEGRKWVGYLGSRNEGSRLGGWITPAGETPSTGYNTGQKSQYIVSNAYKSMGASNSYGNHAAYEITLHAGDMIHSYNSTTNAQISFHGVESDA